MSRFLSPSSVITAASRRKVTSATEIMAMQARRRNVLYAALSVAAPMGMLAARMCMGTPIATVEPLPPVLTAEAPTVEEPAVTVAADVVTGLPITDQSDYESMTKADLLALATANNIRALKSWRKPEIIEAIRSHYSAAARIG